MNADALIAARVTPETKRRFAQLADEYGVSESALLKRLIDRAIDAGGVRSDADRPNETSATGSRMSLRLRPEDLALLQERAGARQMPTSTYAVWLLRAHLRNLTPMPPAELSAFKRAVAEVGAIGRNLNQIVRSINRGEANPGVSKADLMALLRALTGLRDHMKSLVGSNQESWRVGYKKARR